MRTYTSSFPSFLSYLQIIPSHAGQYGPLTQAIVQAGLSGLFMASMNGHLDVVRLLLDSKANANLADQVPKTLC